MSAKDNQRLINIHSATGDSGRLHPLTTGNPQDQARSAFGEMQRQMDVDSNNESNQFSVGSDQSKSAALDVDKLIASSPTPVRIVDSSRYGGGYYHPGENHIGLSKKKDINVLAHEMGHAEFQKDTLGKLTQNRPARIMHVISPAVGVLAGSSITGTPGQRAVKSLILALGLSSPTLLSEGMASYKGYHILKEHGATPEELDAYVSGIAGPQSTYLIHPVVATAVGYMSSAKTARLKTAKANKLARRTTFRDLEISIETDKGQYREWYDPNNKKHGKTLMNYPYGYIRGTKGMDGDHVDCFIGPNVNAKNVYVITTNKSPNFDRLDEQKVMLGFVSAGAAKHAFLSSYSSPRFFNSMRAFTYDDFKNKVYKTLHSRVKKIGSTANFDGMHNWNRNSAGPAHDQVPGDYLGFPASSLVGLRQVEGNPMAPSDRIDRMFRFNDQETNTRVLDGNTAAAPADPAV
jgi:hypothetical protein